MFWVSRVWGVMHGRIDCAGRIFGHCVAVNGGGGQQGAD